MNSRFLKVLNRISAEIILAYISTIPILIGVYLFFVQYKLRLANSMLGLGNLLVTFFCLLYLIRNGKFRRTTFWRPTILLLFVIAIGVVTSVEHRDKTNEIIIFCRILIFVMYSWWYLRREDKGIKNLLKLIWVALIFVILILTERNEDLSMLIILLSTLILLTISSLNIFNKLKRQLH